MGVVRARGGVGTHWQQKCNQVWVVARPGWCGVGGEGAGGCGHALAAFKYSLNTKKMRARSV